MIAGRLEKSADQYGEKTKQKKKLEGCHDRNLIGNRDRGRILKGGTSGSEEFHSIPKLEPNKSENKFTVVSHSSALARKKTTSEFMGLIITNGIMNMASISFPYM